MSLYDLPAAEFGRPKAEAGQWGSLIRVVDPLGVSIADSGAVLAGVDLCSRMFSGRITADGGSR